MTKLNAILQARIGNHGPISIADYMAECLLHPELGYYSRRDPFGAKGDFTTAPEISQMFGELLGLWLAQSWIDAGQPPSFVLAEIGPGRGTLMADVWRATKGVPGFHDAAKPYLIEASAHLRSVQKATLGGANANWVGTIDELPDAPLFLLANEFFDALPIRQYKRQKSGWSELLIGGNADGLCFGQAAPSPNTSLDHRLDDTNEGDLVEVCSAMQGVMETVNDRIKTNGGVALVVDYGDWRSLGSTLQAIKSHAFVDVLTNSGEADLTAHVDFEALANAAPDLNYSRLTPQGIFLQRLGIDHRAEVLGNQLSGAALESHKAAHHRLTAADEMGTLFKVMAFYAPNSPLPPGFQQ